MTKYYTKIFSLRVLLDPKHLGKDGHPTNAPLVFNCEEFSDPFKGLKLVRKSLEIYTEFCAINHFGRLKKDFLRLQFLWDQIWTRRNNIYLNKEAPT